METVRRASGSIGRLTAGVALAAALGWITVVSAQSRAQPARSGVRVSGTVVDAYPDVTPVATRVTLAPLPGTRVGFGGVPILRANLRQDRTFVFENVPPGAYQLSTFLGSELSVQVGSRDVAGLQLRHLGLTELFISVRMDDGSEVQADRLSFDLELGNGETMHGGLSPAWPLRLPPGRGYLFLEPPEGMFVRSLVSAGVDLLREPLTIEPVAPERGLQVVLTRSPAHAPKLARVRGRVTGGDGPLTVALVSSMSPRRATFGPVPVARDGSFDIEVEPGVYDVYVPPAFSVISGLAVPHAGRTIEVSLPKGYLFGGGGVRVLDQRGQSLPYIVRCTLVARNAAGVWRFPVQSAGFWGALPPGEYRLTVENLEAGVSVATFEAGGRNLLEQPYVISVDRAPARITLALRYSGPLPDWVGR